jgi:positive regulator of sigma E activity
MAFPKVLWILFNLFLIVVIAYIVINTYKTYIKKASLQTQHNEMLIRKLDELIELNKTIIDHFTSK